MGKLKIEIDPDSGFCGGVIRAITTAEKELSAGGCIYSLGAIVHNEMELSRLTSLGLREVSIPALKDLPRSSSVLIRAHGEPPATYSEISECGLRLVDCTCPVVLRLQQDIATAASSGSRIVIFGKKGHAEVLGLLGHAGKDAIVVEHVSDVPAAMTSIPADAVVELFSQTTKSPSEYGEVADALGKALAKGRLVVHDTICSQVRGRHLHLAQFAAAHDVVLFVSGGESSNGKVLSDLCAAVNPRTYHITSASDIKDEWFCVDAPEGDFLSVGICGATSTPRWLLTQVAENLAVRDSFCNFVV